MRWVARAPNVMGVSKIPFSRVFGFLLPNELLCQEAASTTTLMYNIYKYVASLIRIEVDEMGSQTPHYVRGGVKNSIFDISRCLAPNLALVPESRLYCNKGI